MLGDLMYLENIREYVEDHKIIVTYKWLSRKMEVPVQAAKQMLYAYVEKNPSVAVTYLISGKTSEGYQVCLTTGNELKTSKEQFQEIFSIHIFSVHETQLKDSDCLFAANYDTNIKHLSEYSRYSPIDCESQSRKEISLGSENKEKVAQKIHSNKAFPQISNKESDAKDKQTSFPQAEKESTKCMKASLPQAEKESTKLKNKKIPPKNKQRKPFFGSSSVKPKPSVKEEIPVHVDDSSKEVDVEDEKESINTVDVVSIKSSPKQSPNQSPERILSSTDCKTEAKSSTREMFGFLNDSDIDDDESADEPVEKSPSRSVQAKDNVKKKKSKSKVTDNTTSRKRKRIQELSSDEELILESENKVPSRNKRRKRTKKLVSKMHINDDGEMVTEKVWESESTDASEEDIAAPCSTATQGQIEQQPIPKPSPIKQEKKKQASLFSFIKK